MPRPRPDPENAPLSVTISLPIKLIIAAEQFRVEHPAEDLRDFSSIISRALAEYIGHREEGLLAEVIAEIREDPGIYGDETPADYAKRLLKKESLKRIAKPGKSRAPRSKAD